jgi:hypothetical protein
VNLDAIVSRTLRTHRGGNKVIAQLIHLCQRQRAGASFGIL